MCRKLPVRQSSPWSFLTTFSGRRQRDAAPSFPDCEASIFWRAGKFRLRLCAHQNPGTGHLHWVPVPPAHLPSRQWKTRLRSPRFIRNGVWMGCGRSQRAEQASQSASARRCESDDAVGVRILVQGYVEDHGHDDVCGRGSSKQSSWTVRWFQRRRMLRRQRRPVHYPPKGPRGSGRRHQLGQKLRSASMAWGLRKSWTSFGLDPSGNAWL